MRNKFVTIARKLRKDQTPHEVKLWRLLRSRRFSGFKFRRQYPIGPHVVDFCCQEKQLVIEVDGGQHTEFSQHQRDSARDKYLASNGYKVIRFWNNDIDQNLDEVTEMIKEILCK